MIVKIARRETGDFPYLPGRDTAAQRCAFQFRGEIHPRPGEKKAEI
jgi:hypothetical protein